MKIDLCEYNSRTSHNLEALINSFLIPCPECGGALELSISSCTDPDCCDTPHRIWHRYSKSNCGFEKNRYCLDYDFLKEFLTEEIEIIGEY